MQSMAFIFLAVLVLSGFRGTEARQSEFFDLMKRSLSGDSLAYWRDAGRGRSSYCNYTGIACDDQERIVGIDISGWSLHGKFPGEICSHVPELRFLRAGDNRFSGGFPVGITNCSFLKVLNMSSAHLTGTLPDFSPWRSLRVLDLSYNSFSGDFPMSFTNLTSLEILNMNENEEMKRWQLPENISGLIRMRSMVLSSCMLEGEIPRSIGNMSSLVDLELSGNYLRGRIPREVGQLRNLQQLELYYNQLEGEIPEEVGQLMELRDLDMSVNNFSGRIPESICRLPKLEVLQVYNSNLTGGIPGVLGNSTTLKILSVYGNSLTGEVPENLGRSSGMTALDVSENKLTGRLPEGVCNGGKLRYLLALNNMLSGEVPERYGDCKSLIRFRVGNNRLEGRLGGGILSLPHASIIDVSYNRLSGSIPESIENARNLSELLLQGNSISGVIPPQISRATNLVKIDLSNNLLSGSIPSEIADLRWLNLLLLQGNRLSSCIPESLSSLASLNLLDLSNNNLTGRIPESLSKLLPNSMNFSNNHLSGVIPAAFVKGGLVESFSGNPGLCVDSSDIGLSKSKSNIPVCAESYDGKKNMNRVWLIIMSVVIVVIGAILFLRRRCLREDKETKETEDTVSSSFLLSYDVKSFHRLRFDEREIVEAMVEKNVVGYGGSGTVYRIELSSGEVVAVKKLWSREAKKAEKVRTLDRELETEVETLGSIRHKNIVKLYCYFSSLELSLLVYEFMPNGNLWDALHADGKLILEWPVRHQIALGIAQGLAYLHHHLMPPIIHRDIKSTNILLDIDYQPKVADFGIAKVLQARGSNDSTTTVIAGTYAYLDPEYAYSSKATTKCDVYSLGVVLMELVTGKKPVEAEFGDNKNIIYWISTKVETKEGAMEVLDKRVSGSFKEEMIKVLCIAIRCTCRTAALRPTMNEVIQLLNDADPCRFNCCNPSNKTTAN